MSKHPNPFCTCDPCKCGPVCTCGLELSERQEKNAQWDEAAQAMRYEIVEIYRPKAQN